MRFGTNDASMVFLVTYCLFYQFLTNRKQRVVLNGLDSSRADIKAGVPQGSFLGSLFFFCTLMVSLKT